MRRRIDIAASILNTPDLLFLDEPTTGLDPRSRNQVWDIVRAVVAHGTTVLLTTQYLDEADRLAGRIAVIDHGKVIAEGTPGELKASVGAGTVHLRLRDAGAAAGRAEQVLAGALGADRCSSTPTRSALTARVARRRQRAARPPSRPRRALAELAAAGIVVDDFSLGQPSLDEVFLALTDHPQRPTTRGGCGMSTATTTERRATSDVHAPSAESLGAVLAPGERAAAAERAVGVADVRLAGDAEDQARARAAVRRDGVPDHHDADVHLPVRRRAGRLADASTCSSCCRASW